MSWRANDKYAQRSCTVPAEQLHFCAGLEMEKGPAPIEAGSFYGAVLIYYWSLIWLGTESYP